MILTALLLGVAVGALVAVFWKDIVGWLQRAAEAVKKAIGKIANGVTVAVKKVYYGMKELSRHYTKTGTQWQETIVSRVISENDVPENIRKRAEMQEEADITDDLNEQLNELELA